MKILFDCRYVRFPRHDGISRYSASLVEALSALHPVTMMISDERQLTMLPDLPWVMGPSPTGPLEPFTGARINKFAPDIVFSPMQTIGPIGRKFALVTTVHDLIYYTNRTPPRNIPGPVRLLWRIYHLTWAFQRALLNRADAHLADSETTRDLMVQHRLSRHPITVVLLGTDRPLKLASRTRPRGNTLVYMGSFMSYKNVDQLVQGMALLPGYRLQLMSRLDGAERARLEGIAPAGSLEFLNGATDEAYQSALANATALVTASKDEGFGLPLVEAMAVGTPLVVSDIPIFREIGGDVASYFEPTPESFATVVRSLEDPKLWKRQSALAVQRSALFDWQIAASALLGVLEETYLARLRNRKHDG